MVFLISVLIILGITTLGLVDPGAFAEGAASLLAVTVEKFGWLYLIATFGFLIFAFYLAFSRFGQIRLGADDEEPEYGDASWFAMLFSAGMGIGLVFWGVAEPMSHYLAPPMGATPATPEAASLAVRFSFFHWGLHAWGIYTVIALAIAYSSFRRGYSGLISSTFIPLLGQERVNGPIGKTIDVLAIIATVFGVATSLGLGTLQINSGLAHMMGLPVSITVQLFIILIVTILYMTSAVTGLDRGILILSNTNLLLAIALLLFTLFAGPTSFIFDLFTNTLGAYLQNLVQMSLRLSPFGNQEWIRSWTLFYWAWWIAWAPFVGMFIARISRGRTIREFVLGVLLVPSLFCFLWFSVFGGTGLYMEMFEGRNIAGAVEADMAVALFSTLQQLPLGAILAGVATLLVTTFFITSADSATFVLGMLSSKGRLNPTLTVKSVWGILQSALAAVLLLTGGLEGLQTASIIAAAPFTVIMIFICVSLLTGLKEEGREMRRRARGGEGGASG